MTQVIKISKQGVNVGTATDPNDFIFDSELNTFKIIATGTVSGDVVGGGGLYDNGTISTAHGLSYIPPVVGFIKLSGDRVLGPSSEEDIFASYRLSSMWADGTSVFFEISDKSSGTHTYNCKYYCFETHL